MKKLTRIFVLAVLAIGTYAAAVQKPQTVATLFGFGGPIPMCEPGEPHCSVDPL